MVHFPFPFLLWCSTVGSISPTGNSGQIADANNRFAFELYHDLREGKEGKNFFFSPISIHTALSMTAQGARTATYEQMANVLHNPKEQATVAASYSQLLAELNPDDKPYKLHAANAIYPAKGVPLRGDFLQSIEQYRGKVEPKDYFSRADESTKEINQWVEDQTANRIKNLIPEGLLNASTRMVLVNAIYFKGDWKTAFDSTSTQQLHFTCRDGQAVMAPLMNARFKPAQVRYAEDNLCQVLELPYAGDDLAMVAMLPRPGQEAAFEESLDQKRWDARVAALRPTEVETYLPKFKHETDYMLADPLKRLGMPLAFSDAADFSGMFQRESVKISEVLHKAFVEVKETGTEAAAATAVIMVDTISMHREELPTHKIFRADRPFVYGIVHKPTGTILFLGAVEKP